MMSNDRDRLATLSMGAVRGVAIALLLAFPPIDERAVIRRPATA